MIAPPAPSPPGDVAPAVSPEDGRALMPHAAERRAERRRHPLVSLWRLLMTWPPSRPSWSDGGTGSGPTSMPDPTGYAGSRVWILLGHLLVLLQLALIAAGHAGLLPVVLRVVAWGG